MFLTRSMPRKRRRELIEACEAIASRDAAPGGWLVHDRDAQDEDLPDSLAAVARQVAAGKPLVEVLVTDDSPAARILSACIETGERTGRLADGLRWWVEWMDQRQRARLRLAIAMLYPCVLIGVTVASMGVVVWNVIPSIEQTYAILLRHPPWWLQILSAAREHLGTTLACIALLILLPPGVWWWRTHGIARGGVPRNRADRWMRRSIAARVATALLQAGQPRSIVARLATMAAGGTRSQADDAFDRLRHQKPIPVLGRELSLALIALHADVLPGEEAQRHLQQLAAQWTEAARTADLRREKWLPMMVAVGSSIAIAASYILLIYLPWVMMLREIVRAGSLAPP